MQTLYHNGDIITMENESDHPEAVIVENGLIKAVGTFETLASQKATDCHMIDLNGKTLMPSFIDGHGHISMASTQYLANANLEDAENFDNIVQILKDFISSNQIPAGEVVIGCLYDHNYLDEKRHPDKWVLDRASSEHPILISHTSSHMGVANSFALKNAKINASTPDPQGGMIAHDPETGEPTGYLEEAAYMTVKKSNEPKLPDPEELLADVQDIYAANGITTAQDGATGANVLSLIRRVGDAGRLKIDIVTYPMAMNAALETLPQLMEENQDIAGQYKNHVKIGGYKVVLDGSPQGKSAWMSEPYEDSGDYRGYPWLTDDQLHASIRKALADDQQLLTHCNGDAAAQQLLDIYEQELAVSDNPNKDNLRPVMIHCQTVREDQLDRMQKLHMIPSIFVCHTWYWGDVHLKNFGEERGRRISPARSALDRGLIYNFHTDTPVTQPKMLHTVWAAVNRITRSGTEIGPEQRIGVYDALKGITINAAYAYFEEDSKGSIKEGKRADLVILDRNPLKIDKMAIRDINVLETIKDGETIYKADL